MTDKQFMLLAIREAYKGIKKGDGGPFGAVIVRKGKVIAAAHNAVLGRNDPTRHAEITAISKAGRKLKNYDLSGCEIYSTTEPCPMCFSAIHWARIGRLIYGTGIADVKKRGFNELAIPVSKIKRMARLPVKIRFGFMRKECTELLKHWDKLPDKRVY